MASCNLTPAPWEPPVLAERLFGRHRRILVFGAPGTGKSTLCGALADAAPGAGGDIACLGADPGLPSFGVPAAVNLARRCQSGWRALAQEPLASLDAGRFRLPLTGAVARLARRSAAEALLIDMPGVVRGVAGAELLAGLAEATRADAVVVLAPDGAAVPLADELRSLGLPLLPVVAHPEARRPAFLQRARWRTRLWDQYLAGAGVHTLGWHGLERLGTPPPRGAESAWTGRSVAWCRRGRPVALGEVLDAGPDSVTVRAHGELARCDALLVRDAHRNADGLLVTLPPATSPPASRRRLPPDLEHREVPAEPGPQPVIRAEPAVATLVNGVLGDPLLHLRLRHQRRSLFFDLGDPGRLAARTAHQVSDVFISHAHFDHIGGFPWLLRSRIAPLPACRVYGPPGLAEHVEGMVRGVLWDRVGERAPRFRVAELHGETLRWYRVRAGQPGPRFHAEQAAPDGLLLQEPGFRVRAAVLDHGTPVLALAFEPARQINVRPERLEAAGLSPGPWLGALKSALLRGDTDAILELPDGSRAAAAELAGRFIRTTPGRRLVYATDFADTEENRRRLADGLAAGADTLICEAPFLEADAGQAARTGHLTTTGCAAIANRAGVRRLIPFHFSRRYAGDLSPLYRELTAACPNTRWAGPPAD